LGTNDLVASALGIDRNNPVGARSDDPLHPGVLRMLRDVVTAAHAAARQVTVCGEMAADPQGVLALVGLGVDALSVPVHQLGAARRARAGQTTAALTEVLPKLLRQRSASQVRELLAPCAKPV